MYNVNQELCTNVELLQNKNQAEASCQSKAEKIIIMIIIIISVISNFE